MKGLSKVQLIDNLGRDPEIRHAPEGKMVAKFSMAVNCTFKNKDGDIIDNTQRFNAEMWASLAKVVEDYLKSRDRIYIEAG